MKTKNLLIAAACLAAGCGGGGDACRTTDLTYIPLVADDPEGGEYTVYVDTRNGKTGGNVPWGGLFFDGYAVVESADGMNFIDRDWNMLAETCFRDVTIFDDGVAWAVRPGGPLEAIDRRGRPLFELRQAEAACAFHEGLAVFTDARGLWGVVDKKGRVVVEPVWAETGPMYVGGLIPVKEAGTDLWGIADTKGELVVACKYEEIGTTDCEEGFRFNYVQALREGRIPVCDASGKWGVIDRKGNLQINPQFDGITLDGKNYLFCKGRNYGWCDRDGKYLINPRYSDACLFAESDLAAVRDGDTDRWGFIDKKGEWAIEPQFRQAMQFLPCGVAPVRDAGSRDWGAVDKHGKYVVNPQFRSIYEYGADDRLLVFDQSGSVGVIDARGKYIVAPDYSNASVGLTRNVSGIGGPYKAASDFVDTEALAELIDAKIRSLKATTAAGLQVAYGLKESRFPRSGGDMTVYNAEETPLVHCKICVTGLNAWSRTSDGWFGYNYTFLPDTPVKSYTLTAEFRGKASRSVGSVMEAMKRKYAYDQERSAFAIPGYAQVLAFPVANGGIVFHVKTE